MILEFLLIAGLLLLVAKGRKTIFYFPIIGTAFDILYGYIESTPLNLGYRYLIFVPLIFIHLLKSKISSHWYIYLFVAYLAFSFLIMLLGEYYQASQFLTLVNVLVILFMYIVGVTYFNSIKQLIYLNKTVSLSILLIIIYLIVIQFANPKLYVPDSSYSSFFITHHFDYNIYLVSFGIIILIFNHILIFKNKGTLLNTILFFTSFVLLILFMKRWAIFASLIGLAYYFYKSDRIFKIYKNYIVFSVFTIVIVTSFLAERIIAQYEIRADKMTLSVVQNEGRFLDYYFIGEYLVYDASVFEIIFGGNLFETRDFGMKYLQQYRNIHPDLLQILYGLGVIGFLIYYNIYLQIFLNLKRVLKKSYTDNITQNLGLIHTTLLIMLAFISLAGGAYRINTPDSIVFLYLGAIQGVVNSRIKNKFTSL